MELEDPNKFGIVPAKILEARNVRRAKEYIKKTGYPIHVLEDALTAWRRKPSNKFHWITQDIVVKILFDQTPFVPQPIKIEPRRDRRNPEAMEVFSLVKESGWNEERFKASKYKEYFKNLLDFCNFASDSLIDEMRECSTT